MKEIEKVSMQELEAIATDGSVKVPDGFGDSLRTELDALAFLSGSPASMPQWIRYAAGIAASLAVITGIGLTLNSQRHRPKDTFNDPEQAYAMLQESFSFISSKMDMGVASVTHETESVLNLTSEIMDKIK